MPQQVGLIVATDPNGVIGVNNAIPWHYKADLVRFKKKTDGGTLIMGRKTFESMGRRHLPGRTSLVVSSTPQSDVQTFPSVDAALEAAQALGKPIWFIGGSQIYGEVIQRGLVDFADVTLVPPVTVPEGAVVATFPLELVTSNFLVQIETSLDSPLEHRRYEPKWLPPKNPSLPPKNPRSLSSWRFRHGVESTPRSSSRSFVRRRR